MRLILLTAIMGIWAAEAAAHSPLKQTLPADGATISDMPAEVILNFKSKIRLTRIRVAHDEKYIEDLNLDSFESFAASYALPVKDMGSGAYSIKWRGLGADGLILNGSFGFVLEE